MTILEKLEQDLIDIEVEVKYLEDEILHPDTIGDAIEALQVLLVEKKKKRTSIKSSITKEKNRLAQILIDEELAALSIIEDAEEVLRLEKHRELHVRLEAVSQNNVAYVELHGHDLHYSHHKKEVCDCEDTDLLEGKVVALEAALQSVKDRQTAEDVNKAAAKASLEVKLKALGLTIEEIRSL